MIPQVNIYFPDNCRSEKEYIANFIFDEILGVSFRTHYTSDRNTKIVLQNNKSIILPDSFFALAQDSWLSESNLPRSGMKAFDIKLLPVPVKLASDFVPVFFGETLNNSQYFSISPDEVKMGIDIFGSCFFLLSRIEECIIKQRDVHGRFSATNSFARQEGFIDRPLVNEYVEILWSCMNFLDSGLQRRSREFKITPTHDVDRPFAYKYKKLASLFLNLGADILLRKKLLYALKGVSRWKSVRKGDLKSDPFNTFSYLIAMGDKYGRQSKYFFIARTKQEKLDCEYDIDDPAIAKIIKCIGESGHQLGLHGSYFSFRNPDLIEREKNKLLSVCDNAKVSMNGLGMRQHYLRWDPASSFKTLTEVGFTYDSTLGFADHAGFRSGVCHNYPAYDIVNRKALKIREYPLVLMESSVMDRNYMNMGATDEALEYMLKLKERCRLYNGEFVFLWHNHRLITERDRYMYEQLMK